MTAAYDEAKRERWSDAINRVHADGDKPTKPARDERPKAHRRTAVASEPTDLVVTRRVRARLGAAFVDIARSRALTANAVRRMHNATPGYPTEPGTTPAMLGVEQTADRWMSRDDALVALDEVERITARIELDSRSLLNLIETWGVTRIGTELSQSAHDNGCVSCNRANHYSPRRVEGGEVCAWCSGALRSINAVRADAGFEPIDSPPLVIVQKHARGQKVTANDIERAAGVPPALTVRRAKR